MPERYRMPVDPNGDNNPHSFALQLIGSGHRILEVGCATGHVTEHLVAAGNQVVGVEADPVSADAARQVIETVHVLDLDVERISAVERSTFDVALLGDVLEHLRAPEVTLIDVVAMLEPEGRVIISVPNLAHADVRLMLLEGRVDYQNEGLLDRTHLRWFTKSSLRELLDAAGLTAVQLRRVRREMGITNVPADHSVHSDATKRFIMADPEAETFQYVVECRLTSELDGAGALPDLLAPSMPVWPVDSCEQIDAERAAWLERVASLEAELEAWEQSTTARLTRPLRAGSARVRRLIRRG